MIVIGADAHKRSHMLAAVDAGTGVLVAELEITADEDGHRRALRWARALATERVWAIEDCRGLTGRLEQELLGAAERVVRVPPKLMGVSRRGERQAGKSDQIDARAIARAVLREGLERFPAAFLDERALEIRLLCDHREDLVAERTRVINRLRWHLLDLCPELEASIPSRHLDRPRTLERIARRLRALERSARVRVAAELVRRVRELTRRVDELERELAALVRIHRPVLLAETGCGPMTAAILIGHTAGAERFPSDGHFARLAGVAPVPVSSGRRHRHRLHRGGDRQLNKALHIIAITRARLDPETRAYLQRKHAEGKTTAEALRCLKRHLARRFHRLLALPPNRAPRRDPIGGSAPIPMPCLT
jgi:transposase